MAFSVFFVPTMTFAVFFVLTMIILLFLYSPKTSFVFLNKHGTSACVFCTFKNRKKPLSISLILSFSPSKATWTLSLSLPRFLSISQSTWAFLDFVNEIGNDSMNRTTISEHNHLRNSPVSWFKF